MLIRSDLRYQEYAVGYLARFWAFPAKFDGTTGSFRTSSEGRQRLFRALLLIFKVYAVLYSIRTFVSAAILKNFPDEVLALGGIGSLSFLAICRIGDNLVNNLDLQAKLWSGFMTRMDKCTGSGGIRDKSWQELLISYLPLLLLPVVLITPVLYSAYPTVPFSLYSLVPTGFESWPALVLCCLGDMVIVSFHLALVNYSLLFVMLFITQTKDELNTLKLDLNRHVLDPERDHHNNSTRPDAQPTAPSSSSEAKDGGDRGRDIKMEVRRYIRMKFSRGSKVKRDVELDGGVEMKEIPSRMKRVARQDFKGKVKSTSMWTIKRKLIGKSEKDSVKWAVKRGVIRDLMAEVTTKNETEQEPPPPPPRPQLITGPQMLRMGCKTLQATNLNFRLLNIAFSEIVFLIRIICFTVSILSGFSAIKLANRYPAFAFFYGVMAVNGVICFVGLFNNAFHLEQQAKQCKKSLLFLASTLVERKQIGIGDLKEVERLEKAIPKLAIFNGRFHALERDAVLNFINFVLNQIVNLLVGF